MSILKFELTEKHISLVRNVNYQSIFDSIGEGELVSVDDVFGITGDLLRDVGLVLYGKPDGEFDPLNSEEITYSEEQKVEIVKLVKELPIAIEIIMNTKGFKVGKYKRRFHLIDWKYIGD